MSAVDEKKKYTTEQAPLVALVEMIEKYNNIYQPLREIYSNLCKLRDAECSNKADVKWKVFNILYGRIPMLSKFSPKQIKFICDYIYDKCKKFDNMYDTNWKVYKADLALLQSVEL
jgi:hypothetical protein